MKAIIEGTESQIKREQFDIRAWEYQGDKQVQNVCSPRFTTEEQAIEYLNNHAHELPKGAGIFLTQIFV